MATPLSSPDFYDRQYAYPMLLLRHFILVSIGFAFLYKKEELLFPTIHIILAFQISTLNIPNKVGTFT